MKETAVGPVPAYLCISGENGRKMYVCGNSAFFLRGNNDSTSFSH